MSFLVRMLTFIPSFNPALQSSRIPHVAPRVSPHVVLPRATASRTRLSSMSATPSAETAAPDVASALEGVRARVGAAVSAWRGASGGSTDGDNPVVQLVAVSKTKPAALVQAAYDAGQRVFGENYVQELVQKAAELPADIHWHFIGPLQTNKAKLLTGVPNLAMVESVDREKVAAALDRALAAAARPALRVMVQVNTSGEASKAGCVPGETVQLARFVTTCENLQLAGLMTIGAPDSSDEPEAFRILAEERKDVATQLDLPETSLMLSMGMSGDFEAAIRMGSDSVRVGSTIFGAREYPDKQ